MNRKATQERSIDEMITTRRGSIGVAPLYPLIEYAGGLRIPDEVFEDPVIQKLEILGVDIIFLYAYKCSSLPQPIGDFNADTLHQRTNDILSYRKEEVSTLQLQVTRPRVS